MLRAGAATAQLDEEELLELDTALQLLLENALLLELDDAP